ncbi:ABC transporter ATP-binding protein [Agromyces silvae]|uniref:ABC transporter ATP-binding protein n=1 Tax=Agromyces silvae TaxID=3388266 RepID=UPI00280B60D8|nr:ABC transporter ATP-binding protein [Agromyces protaetiae]
MNRAAESPAVDLLRPDESTALLSVQDLVTEFRTEGGKVRGVDGVSFDVRPGECLGVVGESGSGKSVTMMSALGLLPRSATVRGRAVFDGVDLVTRTDRQLAALRGKDIGVIFQDPMTALNPVMTVGAQIAETIRRHQPGLARSQVTARVHELLADVGIADPESRARQYPHQFSGGMRQRVMIAIAIANRPKLIIADEPTTALDVTIQAQILDLLVRVQGEVGASLVLITHDLGVIAEMADRVVVMYGGRVVETAPVDAIFHDTRHPYTKALLASLPRMDEDQERLAGVSAARRAAAGAGPLVRVGPDHYVAAEHAGAPTPPDGDAATEPGTDTEEVA